MEGQPRPYFFANGEVPLVTDNAAARSFIAATGRKDQTKPGSESRKALAFINRLKAIVELNVTDAALTFSPHAYVRRGDGI